MMRGKKHSKLHKKHQKLHKNAKICQIAKMQKIAKKIAIFQKIAKNRSRDFSRRTATDLSL